MSEPEKSFSKRFGHESEEPEITIREDAPKKFRYVMLDIARDQRSVRPEKLREIVCRVLKERPDQANNRRYSDIVKEVQDLVDNCEWFCVYDITEAIYQYVVKHNMYPKKFESAVNDCFREMGIGYQLKDGLVQVRGDDAFEATVVQASEVLTNAELPTAKGELAEAIRDLSRRPKPDLSGAVHHATGALECVAREATGDPKLTLGEILKRHPDLLPKPLDDALSKVWGYASEQARHVKEGREITREEAQLVVGLAAVASTYLAQKLRQN